MTTAPISPLSSPRVLPPVLSALPPVQRQEFRVMVQETLGEAFASSVQHCTESSLEITIDKLMQDCAPLLKASLMRFFTQEADDNCFDTKGPLMVLKSLFFSLFLALSRYHSLEPHSCHFLSMADWYIMAKSPMPGDFGEAARDPLALIWFDQWNTMKDLSDTLRDRSLHSVVLGTIQFSPLFKDVKTPFSFVKKLRLGLGLKATFEMPRPDFIYSVAMKAQTSNSKTKRQRSIWVNREKTRLPLVWITDIMNSRGACSTTFGNVNKEEIAASGVGGAFGFPILLPSLFTGETVNPAEVSLVNCRFFCFWHMQSDSYRILPINTTPAVIAIPILKVWNVPVAEQRPRIPKENSRVDPSPTPQKPFVSRPTPPPAAAAAARQSTSFAPSFEVEPENEEREEASDFYVQSAKKTESKSNRKSKAKRRSFSKDEDSEEEEEDSFVHSRQHELKKRLKNISNEDTDEEEEEDEDFDFRKRSNKRKRVPESQSLDSNESRDADSDEMEDINRIAEVEEREGLESGIVIPDEFDRDELDIYDQLNESDRMFVNYSIDRIKTLHRLAKKKGLKPFPSDEEEAERETKEPTAKRRKPNEAKVSSSERELDSHKPFSLPDKIHYTSLAPGYTAENGPLYVAFVSLLNVAALLPSNPDYDSAWIVLQKAIADPTDLSSRGRYLRDPKDAVPTYPPVFGQAKEDAKLIALLMILLEKSEDKKKVTMVDPGCPALRRKFLACLVIYCQKIINDSNTDPSVLVEFERQTEVWRTTKSSHQLLQYMMDDDTIFNLARILMGGCVTLGNRHICLESKKTKQ